MLVTTNYLMDYCKSSQKNLVTLNEISTVFW